MRTDRHRNGLRLVAAAADKMQIPQGLVRSPSSHVLTCSPSCASFHFFGVSLVSLLLFSFSPCSNLIGSLTFSGNQSPTVHVIPNITTLLPVPGNLLGLLDH